MEWLFAIYCSQSFGVIITSYPIRAAHNNTKVSKKYYHSTIHNRQIQLCAPLFIVFFYFHVSILFYIFFKRIFFFFYI